MGKIIGIDLGTTNTCAAVMIGGNPEIIPNSDGGRTTPSIVAFKKDPSGGQLVGSIAKRQAVGNPNGTIYSIKRFMGKQYEQALDEVSRVPYSVSKNSKGGCCVKVNGEEYVPQQISAMILKKIKSEAEKFLNETVSEAVITVPAYFNDAERQATKEAGAIAGLNVKRIINEPTAAALSYGLDKKNKNEKIAVFDLGGGTFDISILELGDGVFEVKATNGDVHLGGDNFDERIIDWMLEEFKKEYGANKDLRQDARTLQSLKSSAEQAKIDLSNSTSTQIYLGPTSEGLSLERTLTRAKFENLCEDLFQKCLKPCEKAMKDSGLSLGDIDEVVLVGGSTRIPKIQEIVKNNKKKDKLNQSVNPDEVVAIGAAIQGGVLAGDVKDVLLLDVTSLSFGIETTGGVFTKLVEANTTIPTRKSQIFSTATDNQTSVSIHVLQGERSMAKDNRSLGMFNLDGIPSAPRGIPQIEVTFDIDANGILNVSAKEKTTGKEQKIRIESSSNLTKEEIDKMKRDAEMNADSDRKAKEFADKINEADNMIFQTEKQLKEYGDKIPSETKSKIESDLAELKKAKDDAIKSQDIAGVDVAKNNLLQSLQAIYQAMQNAQNQGGNTNSNGGEQTKTSDSNAKETSYEEVK